MSKKISPIPRGYRTATTCLTVVDVDSALAFYQAAFGAEILTRLTEADELPAMHATIKIGNSIIALNREAPEQGVFSPLSLGAAASQVHLYVEDIDASWERAIEAGAIVHTAVYDAFWGDRIGILLDGNGHMWSIASKVENVSQEEVQRRARAGLVTETLMQEVEQVPFEVLAAQEVLADESVAV
ncbi:MAG: VOC family protein [Gammaproteobacteria bacterium]|nr:VOC family protein [Gammaproteobacteria bacterium]